MMNKNKITIKRVIGILLISIYIVFITDGLNFIGWSFWVPKYADYLLCVALMIFYVYSKLWLRNGKSYSSRIIDLVILLPLLSAFLKVLLRSGETFNIEIQNTFIPVSSFVMFYVFLKIRTSNDTIMGAVILIGIVTFLIQLYQQFYPELALFVVQKEGDDFAGNVDLTRYMRSGMLRFLVGSMTIGLFCMYYYWTKLLSEKTRIINILFFLLFASSVYMYLTRQTLVAALITICLSVFIRKGRVRKGHMFFFLFLFVISMIVFYDTLFSNLVEETQDNEYSHAIRFEFIPFLIFESIKDPLFFVFGHGGYSNVEKIWEGRGYFLSDVGVFGALWKYGFIYVLVYFRTLFLFAYKFGNKIPYPVRLYFISTFINCPFMFPYNSSVECFMWACMLYLTLCESDGTSPRQKLCKEIKIYRG